MIEWPEFMDKHPPEFWTDKELNTWLVTVSIYSKEKRNT
jgi:hypothetical protein